MDLLVCAGLPAEKWRANMDPMADWANMSQLAQILGSVRAERSILISTVDVFQPAIGVDETSTPDLAGEGAYGSHRAWFEFFFRAQFRNALILRLPGLFAADVRKNLVHDLLHSKKDQLSNVNPQSTYQFFDVTKTWELITCASDLGLMLLNVSSEPVSAQEVADLFDERLTGSSPEVHYDMRSTHSAALGGAHGYLFERSSVLGGIAALRDGGVRR